MVNRLAQASYKNFFCFVLGGYKITSVSLQPEQLGILRKRVLCKLQGVTCNTCICFCNSAFNCISNPEVIYYFLSLGECPIPLPVSYKMGNRSSVLSTVAATFSMTKLYTHIATQSWISFHSYVPLNGTERLWVNRGWEDLKVARCYLRFYRSAY